MAERGALILHSLTATPRSVRGLADELEAAGFRTRVPLLPGHGGSLDDLEAGRWVDWVATADASYRDLASECDRVVVVGMSVGGSVACWLAAEHAPGSVAGLIVVNPSIDPAAESYRAILRQLQAVGIRGFPGLILDTPRRVLDAHGSSPAHEEIPFAPILSLHEGLDSLLPRLGRIVCPTLIMTSRADEIVPIVSSDILAERVGGSVERVWLERRHHMASLDYDRPATLRAMEFARAVADGQARGDAAQPLT